MRHILLSILFFISLQKAKAQEQFAVFFDSDKFELTAKEKTKLAQWLNDNKQNKIIAIYGYTDEVGSVGFNDTLAQKRVDNIYNLLKNQIKIRDDFKTISFGEKFKQSKNKAENRKVVIHYILEKDLVRENEILGIKEKVDNPIPKTEVAYPEKLVFENPNGSKSEFHLDREFMKQLGNSNPGEKLKIENLNFVINTFIVENSSKGKLYELLLVMQNNPKLKIEIQGHLCCQPKDRLDLSTQRAQSIYRFLIANGIDKKRLSYKGFGSSEPIYPLPEKNEMERAANRRVEILIKEN